MILRNEFGYPVRWWQFWRINLARTWEARLVHYCYVCGKTTNLEPSRHWPSSLICDDCAPQDAEHAAAYARHCETGE